MADANADLIRAYVNRSYIEPARQSGITTVEVVAGDVHRDLGLENRMPAVCSALDARRFQEEYRVILNSRTGPKQSSTARWRFGVRP